MKSVESVHTTFQSKIKNKKDNPISQPSTRARIKRKRMGENALCEINIEEIEIQPRLDDPRRHCNGICGAFCEISTRRGSVTCLCFPCGQKIGMGREVDPITPSQNNTGLELDPEHNKPNPTSTHTITQPPPRRPSSHHNLPPKLHAFRRKRKLTYKSN